MNFLAAKTSHAQGEIELPWFTQGQYTQPKRHEAMFVLFEEKKC
jgi:hypothetical protein